MKAYIQKNKIRVLRYSFYTFLLVYSVFTIDTTEALEVDYNNILSDTDYNFNNPLLEPNTSLLISSISNTNMGTLTASVYYSNDKDTYLYKLILDPAVYIQDIFSFSTAFKVNGFDQNVQRYGYNSVEANTATGVADAFSISYSPVSGQLKFKIDNTTAEWSGSDNDALPITFFFESTYAPGLNTYGIINSYEPGITQNYAPVTAPVPEPGTIMLMLAGFTCLTGIKLINIFKLRINE